MKLLNHLGTAAICLCVPVGAALASDVIPSSSDAFSVYGEVENYTIYQDATTGTCLAEFVDDEGNVLQMGLTKDHQYGYIGVFTLADVKTKKRQDVAVAVDGSIFTGEIKSIKSKKLKGDYSGGYVLTNNPDFVAAIENGEELVAFPEKTGSFVVNLKGSKRAIEEVRKCNMESGG